MVLSAMDMISNGFAQTDQTDQAKEVKKDPVDMFYARMNSQTSEYEYDEFDEKDKKKKQKKTCGPIGDLKCYTDAPLYQALCPFFIAMKFVGLFHNKCYKEHWEGKGTPPLSKRITPSSVYCFVGVLVAWSHIGRTLYLFKDNEDGFGPYMFQKFIFLCYTMYCSVNATCCFLACHKYTNIPEFFYEWARLHKEYPGECTGLNTVRISRLQLSLLPISTVYRIHLCLRQTLLSQIEHQNSWCVWACVQFQKFQGNVRLGNQGVKS